MDSENTIGEMQKMQKRKDAVAMDQLEIKQILTDVGVDYNKGLERFVGNVALYHKFLAKFLDDTSYGEFVQALAAGDLEKAGKSVHTLKGTAGNLSLMNLFKAADKTVQAIRAHKSQEEIELLAQNVKQVYEENCQAIRQTVG